MNPGKNCTEKPYSLIVIDTTLASDNPLHFRRKLIMTFGDKIREEKIQYYINSEAAKISKLSTGKLININVLQVKEYYLLIKVE